MKLYFTMLILFICSLTTAQDPIVSEINLFIQKGDFQMRNGNFLLAEEAYNVAIELDDRLAEAYMKRAKLYQLQSRLSESLADYNKAIALDPYSEYLYNRRSKLKMLSMDYKGALKDINQAIAIDPHNDNLLDTRIEDLIALRQYERALRDIDTLIDHQMQKETAYEKRALVLLLMNDLEGCNEAINNALRINPNSSIAYA